MPRPSLGPRIPGCVLASAMGVVAIAGAVWLWTTLSQTRTLRQPFTGTQQAIDNGPSPKSSPAEVLGLSPQLPDTAEALNQEAFKTCELLVRDVPTRPEAQAVAAFIFNRHGRTDEAAKCWKKALELNPSFAPAYCGLGIAAADKGDYARAIELLTKAVALDSGNGRAYNQLVDVLLREAKTEEALATAKRYVRRFPEAADSQYWLGQTYLDLENFEAARTSHEEAIRLDPSYTAAYYSLATVCARLKDRDSARRYREKFAELKEQDLQRERSESRRYEDLPAQRELAASYHAAAGNVHATFGDPEKAEAHWLRGAAVAPETRGCRESLVDFYAGQGRPFDALERLDQLLAIEPSNAAYLSRRGRLLADLGQYQAAEDAFRKAVEVAADKPDGYVGLVDLYLQFQQTIPDVVTVADRAVTLEPSAQTYMRLSAVRDKHGDRKGAIVAAERALDLEPNNAFARRVYEQLSTNP